jgi:DNA repair exonuclease SbcCD ATPase subunit
MEIKNISLENYKGTQAFTHDLFHRTLISGKNATGKTTLMDAYYDVLTGKLSDGSAPDAIRPHNSDGEEIDRVPVKRSVTLDADVLTKVTEQKWRKPRGQVEEVLDGNVTSYQINGFDKKKKDFEKYLSDIADSDTLLMCSNSRPFISKMLKSTAEARKYLEKLCGFSVDDFIRDNDKYKDIQSITDGNPVEDVVKKLKKELSLQKKEVEKISNNLEHESSKTFDFDDAAHKKVMEEAETLLATIERTKIARADAESHRIEAAEKRNRWSEKKETLAANLKRLIADASASYEQNMKMQLKDALIAQKDAESAQHEVSQRESYVKMMYSSAIKENDRYNALKEKIKDVENRIKETENESFSDDTCPLCGQKLPEDKVKDSVKRFNVAKDSKIETLKTTLNSLQRELETADKERHSYKSSYEQGTKDLAELRKKLEEVKNKQSEYKINYPAFDPTEVKESDEYKAVEKEIKDIDKEIATIDEFISRPLPDVDINAERNARKAIEDAKIEKATFERMVANNKATVEALTAELRTQGQLVASIEQKIDLIQSFSVAKNKAIENLVNKYFSKISFSFFDTTYEGNVYETLRIMVNGTDYLNGLNHGDRILADIDLVCGFQKMNNLNLPIWVDDVESLDADRVPEIEQQLIMLRVTEDSKLTIKEV